MPDIVQNYYVNKPNRCISHWIYVPFTCSISRWWLEILHGCRMMWLKPICRLEMLFWLMILLLHIMYSHAHLTTIFIWIVEANICFLPASRKERGRRDLTDCLHSDSMRKLLGPVVHFNKFEWNYDMYYTSANIAALACRVHDGSCLPCDSGKVSFSMII